MVTGGRALASRRSIWELTLFPGVTIPPPVHQIRSDRKRCGCHQGGRGWLAFGDRKIIPESFCRASICKFSRMTFVKSSTKSLLKTILSFATKQLILGVLLFVEDLDLSGTSSPPTSATLDGINESTLEQSLPVHCCTPSLCYLGGQTDDHHRNPNNNMYNCTYRDHLVGQLTN